MNISSSKVLAECLGKIKVKWYKEEEHIDNLIILSRKDKDANRGRMSGTNPSIDYWIHSFSEE